MHGRDLTSDTPQQGVLRLNVSLSRPFALQCLVEGDFAQVP
jgi:hypothetical protein